MKTRYSINSIILLLSIFIASCGQTDKTTGETKKEELKKLKTELNELKSKIAKLEKVVQEEDGISDKILKVKTLTIKNAPFESYVNITGNVESDDVISASPEASGIITEILVTEGDEVAKGQLLAKLNTTMLERGIKELEINLELSRTKYERQEKLWKQNIGSEIQYLEAKSTKEQLEQKLAGMQAQLQQARITAPFNGIIDRINQKKGELASPQTTFARIVNLDEVHVYADLSEVYLSVVNKDDEVKLNFPVLNFTTTSIISQVGNIIDPDNRTFRIKVNLKNNKHRIKPNMTAIVSIKNFESDSAITVPSILVKKDFKGEYLYTATKTDNGYKAQKVYVQPGLNTGNTTLINGGLEVGDLIISEGYAQVVDELSVAVAN